MLIFYTSLIDERSHKSYFETIYHQYRKQMLYVADSVLHNKSDAEDAVHNAFIGIAKNIDTVRKIENETDRRNYLLKSAKNAALSMLPQVRKPEEPLSDSETDCVSDRDFVEMICRKADYDKIVAEMLSMDPRYRDALYYHFVLEFSIPQTAKALGRSVSAVKQQLVRGKKLLLENLKEEITL